MATLRVAARTSCFAFKGKDTDVRHIGRELGVRTVLEGSVRKAGRRLRVTAQLIDVATGYHVWSQSYDREMEDVFVVQDEIAREIGETFHPRPAGATAPERGRFRLHCHIALTYFGSNKRPSPRRSR